MSVSMFGFSLSFMFFTRTTGDSTTATHIYSPLARTRKTSKWGRILDVEIPAATGCTRRPRRVVLVGEGDAALVKDALNARVAVIGRTVPCREKALWTAVVRKAFPWVGFGAWVVVVRHAFPRRDDDFRAPRDRPRGLPPDFDVCVASTTDGLGGLVPGLVVRAGGANRETPVQGRELRHGARAAPAAHEGR